MRVVAGTAGGRPIRSPQNKATRPTTDRVREAIFNSLASLNVVSGALVLDLFAGTGACGIEALSRGSESATFVDNDRNAVSVIEQNLSDLDLEGEVVKADAMSYLHSNEQLFDLAIVDPPYAFDQWHALLAVLPAQVAVLEASRAVEVPEPWSTVRSKGYGGTHVTIVTKP